MGVGSGWWCGVAFMVEWWVSISDDVLVVAWGDAGAVVVVCHDDAGLGVVEHEAESFGGIVWV